MLAVRDAVAEAKVRTNLHGFFLLFVYDSVLSVLTNK